MGATAIVKVEPGAADERAIGCDLDHRDLASKMDPAWNEVGLYLLDTVAKIRNLTEE
ncbi:hypothetical protein WME94_43440 [Sorangium sp. So ce429]